MNFTSKLSPYYGMYVIMGFVFHFAAKVCNFLNLNFAVKAVFGNYVIGINDNRPKEAAPKDSVSKTEIDHLATLASIWWDKKDKARMLHTFYQVRNDSRPKETAPEDSVSKTEIEHLAKMVDFWWDAKGKAKMIHAFYQVRVPLVVEGLAETGRISKADMTKPDALKGVRILEAGCGGGILAEDLARLGAYVVGVDPGKEMIDLAKRHLETKSPELKDLIEYHAITVEEHAEKFAGTYDAIVCSEVMEHVDEKEPILEACCRCLKSGGSLFLTTENQTLMAWLVFIIIPEYILGFMPKNTHFYEKFVSPAEISKMISKFGCQTRRVRGFFYDRMFNTWSFINNDDCNYGLHAVKK